MAPTTRANATMPSLIAVPILNGLSDSIATAQRLGAPLLIAQAGPELPGVPRADQRAALVACLRKAAERLEGSGVRLGVEPLNTRIDHPGYLLPSTAETLDIVEEVGQPEIGIVYDLYHSAVMGESTETVLAGQVSRVFHAHVADHPGRNDPGLGEIDLAARLRWLFGHGYRGLVGLEYQPAHGTIAGLPGVFASLNGQG
ncbi:TIM barrel protein [Tropicimonas sp.]|uniref:TIM barrel protein n=1 Tax=Tropicimonas sp. TaxID=2067044 RepID=UPI003A8793EB